ncbi:MAG TPA: hypothetical protein VGK20_01990 [Candidatus Binatia bacterium]|jgi:hypothetical protein
MPRKSDIDRNTKLVAIAFGAVGVAALLAAQLLLPITARAASVGADAAVNADCVESCMTALHTCLADAHSAFVDCSTTQNCLTLAASAKLACAGDKSSSICLEARAQFQSCIKPCRTALRQDVRTCQNLALTCLHDSCNLADLPPQCRAPMTE